MVFGPMYTHLDKELRMTRELENRNKVKGRGIGIAVCPGTCGGYSCP
jgi:hypothetical protein